MRAIAIAILLAACGSKSSPSTVDAPLVCTPAGGCASGPSCGGTCCGAGEHCVDGACHCGTGSACGPGDQCSSGPVMTNRCGTFCCGATGPCPQ
jgi:hypothetical protein